MRLLSLAAAGQRGTGRARATRKKKEIAALFKASQIVRILQLGQRYCSLLAPVSLCVSYERDSLQKDRAWSP